MSSSPLKILVLMAGSDTLFREAGYQFPKNLVEIEGKSILERVVENLRPLREKFQAESIFLFNKDECRQYHTHSVVKLLDPKASVIEVEQPTAGAACTALLAIEHVDNSSPLLVINGDELIQHNLVNIIEDFRTRTLDAGVAVFESVHPRWSYVKTDSKGFVMEAAEKRPISNSATAGFYYFAKGAEFVQAIKDMISKDAHVNNVFYICPCFNELVLKTKKVGTFKINKKDYLTFKSPQEVEAFKNSNLHL